MKHEDEAPVERKAPGGMAADFRVPQELGAHVWLLASAALEEAMGGLRNWPCVGVWNPALATVGYALLASHG